MIKETHEYHILLVEDNPGDRLLVSTHLEDSFLVPRITEAETLKEVKALFAQKKNFFDVILLDLELPDKKGTELIEEVVQLAGQIPVLILTGYTNVSFSKTAVKLGISDYLLKDDLSPSIIYKSIIYSIERKRIFHQLEDSEKKYRELFELSPLPMWVYDLDTLKFLDVNESAISNYGYDKKEFLSMTSKDIIPLEEMTLFEEGLERRKKHKGLVVSGFSRQLKKNGEIMDVEVSSNMIDFHGRKAVLVLSVDVTLKKKYIEAIELQNAKLKEIAWIQSHVVRAPLARLMGIVNLLEIEKEEDPQKEIQSFDELIQLIKASATELDDIIKEITAKTDRIKLD